MKDKTTEKERLAYRLKLRSLPAARQMLAAELLRRHIPGPAVRDARPLKIQHVLEGRLLAGQSLA